MAGDKADRIGLNLEIENMTDEGYRKLWDGLGDEADRLNGAGIGERRPTGHAASNYWRRDQTVSRSSAGDLPNVFLRRYTG